MILVLGFFNIKYKNLIIFFLKKKNYQLIYVYDIGWIIIRFVDVKKIDVFVLIFFLLFDVLY